MDVGGEVGPREGICLDQDSPAKQRLRRLQSLSPIPDSMLFDVPEVKNSRKPGISLFQRLELDVPLEIIW